MQKQLILCVLLLVLVFKANAKFGAMAGKVVDDQGEPVIGAVVQF